MQTIKIELYLSPECPSEESLRENIAGVLAAEKMKADVSLFRIDDDKASALKLTGSPSVFIDGEELQPQNAVGFS